MPFTHNVLKFTTGIQVFSQVNKYTLSYRFLYGNVQGCVFAKNRPVSLNHLNWTDYILLDFCRLIVKIVVDMKLLYSNVARIAFRGKLHFVCYIGQVKQTFIA